MFREEIRSIQCHVRKIRGVPEGPLMAGKSTLFFFADLSNYQDPPKKEKKKDPLGIGLFGRPGLSSICAVRVGGVGCSFFDSLRQFAPDCLGLIFPLILVQRRIKVAHFARQFVFTVLVFGHTDIDIVLLLILDFV
jgi:hypothetical protein